MQLQEKLASLSADRCRACNGDPQAVIGEWEFGAKRESIFRFKPEGFKNYFGEVEPKGRSWVFGNNVDTKEYWIASKEMVEQLVQDRQTNRALFGTRL